jgi:hypothetical protein
MFHATLHLELALLAEVVQVERTQLPELDESFAFGEVVVFEGVLID